MSEWVQVLVPVGADEVEQVSDVLWAAGVAGIEERDGPSGGVVLVAGLSADGLDRVEASLAGRPFEVVGIEADAGLDGWRAHARPVRVGAVEVWPAWIDEPEPEPEGAGLGGSVRVRLDAGRSFGHGAHVTTRLALQLLQDAMPAGGRVLDVGCGSGVLAIAAALLGAATVVAVDIDPEAVRASVENTVRNEVGTVVEVRRGSLDGPTATVGVDAASFDLVAANIEAPVLIELAAAIEARLAPGALLVLSGFLAAQEDRVRRAFGTLVDRARVEDDDWVGLLLRRP